MRDGEPRRRTHALIRANELGARLGIDDLWIKDESRNPTWSHKDRFSAIAVSFAKRQGHRFIATASSGNAGASLAAYAARAGLNCLVVTFEGAPGPVVDQIRRYGAVVVELADKTRRWPILAEGQHGSAGS
ncbi:pyridoxal-phosphate dependent enzyme [Tistrella bauzanensis]